MATATQEIWDSGSDGAAFASVQFDDVTGAISLLSWVVNSGTVTVIVFKNGVIAPGFPKSVTTSGSMPVPAGYNLTKRVKNGQTDWYWQSGTLDKTVTWQA